jgi:hypothetical protein
MDILDNKYFSTAVTLGLALYATLLGPNLPEPIKKIFSNTLFRIGVLALVVVRGNQDPAMAIMIAVAFVLTLDYINLASSKEMFATTCHPEQVPDANGRCVECPAPSQYNRVVNDCVDKKAPKCAADSGWDVWNKKCRKCDTGKEIRVDSYNICVLDV